MWWKSYICDIKFETLQVRENEILLRKWSGGIAQLRTLEVTLLICQQISRHITCKNRRIKFDENHIQA